MIDFDRVVGFQWDEGNARKNAEKHFVSQSEAEQVFFNEPVVLLADPRHSMIEDRFHALGTTDDGRRLLIAYTLRADGTRIRIISARDMNRQERKRYDSQA